MKPKQFVDQFKDPHAFAMVFTFAVALTGCGSDGGGMSVLGPGGGEETSIVGLAKRASGPVSTHLEVVATVTRDEAPLEGVVVALSRSISGQSHDFRWEGTTDTNGRAVIEVETPTTGQFRHVGVSGYYVARATDPVSGEQVGSWGSIPLNGGKPNFLSLPTEGPADVGSGTSVIAMTRNLYLGAPIDPILSAPSPEAIPGLVTEGWLGIQATNFPERARAIADEIAASRPHLVGLQEVSQFRIQSPGDFLAGNPTSATAFVLDYLSILLEELDARGLSYRAVATTTNADIELPMVSGFTDEGAPLFDDLRLTDREVILARADVEVANVQVENFSTNLAVPVGGGAPITVLRGWAAVDATIRGRTVRFVSTHLETKSFAPIQEAQAAELLQVLSDEDLPVILVGDFNSAADGSTTQSYGTVTDAGFVDVWGQVAPNAPGHTCCMESDLLNETASLDRRIDLIFARDAFTIVEQRIVGAVDGEVVGEEPADRAPSGLWPSDHAGVVAELLLPPAPLFALP